MKKFLGMMVILFSLSVGAITARADLNIYRLYNPNTGEHFYTSNVTEKSGLVNAGWLDEGVGWVAPERGLPVYRLYNPNAEGGDHYYTLSKFERDSLVRTGWHYDGVFWDSGGSVPVRVAYNPNASSGAHHYMTDQAELNNLLQAGWIFPSVAWQAVKPGWGNPNFTVMRPMTGDYWNKSSEVIPYPNVRNYPNVSIVVNRSEQRAYVQSNGKTIYTMYCTTARPGLGVTPPGTYAIQAEHGATLNEYGYAVAKTYSSWSGHGLYLFHSVVFNPNGTVDVAQASQLGRTPQSHGCVRLSIPDAAWVYTFPVGTTVVIL